MIIVIFLISSIQMMIGGHQTLLLYDNGKLINSTIGLISYEELEAKLSENNFYLVRSLRLMAIERSARLSTP